jgi:hypothetical protein
VYRKIYRKPEDASMPRNPAEQKEVARPPTPHWVKGFVAAGLMLVALAAVMLSTGHGATAETPK